VNLVDSSAWIAYFTGEKNAGKFRRAAEDIDQLVVASISLTEVFKFMFRHLDETHALDAVAHMKMGLVVSLDSQLAIEAAALGMELRLPLADSIIYATARKFDATLWTQDADFQDFPGVRIFM
jgi:predicted nucleic acid-binding protein